jgi:hypothetical protein
MSMVKIRAGRPRALDYKACFDYWLQYNTAYNATQALFRDGYGIETPDGTLKPYAVSAVRRAAWLWVIEHPDESLKVWQEEGYFLDGKTDEWKEWISKKIVTHTSCTARNRALKINGIKEWYDERYTR